MTNQFFDPTNSSYIPYGKGKKQPDPRWSTCPVGQAFIINVDESLVRAGKKRPSIPAAYAGQYRTKALQQPWGYLVDHYRGG